MYHPIRVLFVCYHNATLSQVAEALLRRIGGQDFQVYSAGIQPEPLSPLAIEVMSQGLRIDISGHMSKSIDKFIGEDFDYLITLCDRARTYMPELPGTHRHIHWHFPDPTKLRGNDDNKRQLLQHLCLELTERIRLWVEKECGHPEELAEPKRYSRMLG